MALGVSPKVAECGKMRQLATRRQAQDRPETPADLAEVMASWPDLPEAIKAGIVAMVKAAKGYQ